MVLHPISVTKGFETILYRKNAMFYETENGAHVEDLFMSLIHTCQLCGTNTFDCLTELQRPAEKLSWNPQQLMPWNYRASHDPAGTFPDTVG